MEEMQQLIRKRGSIKSRLTIFKNFISNIEDSVTQNENLSEPDVISLEMKTNNSELLLNSFEEIQIQIECIVEADDLANQIKERETFETIYYESMAKAKNILSNQRPNQPNYDARSNADTSESHNVNVAKSHIKLPTISLPKFDGAYHEWLEFRDTFNSLINMNDQISEIQRFHYLKACLKGNAAQIIESLQLSTANYAIAWDTLCERYNKTDLLVQNHVKSLFNIDPIQKESSAKLRKIIEDVTKNLRALNSLQEPTSQWDTLIVFMIGSKLDSNTEQEWEKCKCDKPKPTLDMFITFLRQRADILEKVEISHSTKGNNCNPKAYTQHRDKPNHSRSLVSINNVNVQCPICKGTHLIRTCDEFLKLNISERNERIREAKLCLNCFNSGHFSQACRKGHCQKCKFKHNTLLHFERVAENKSANTDNPTKETETPNKALSVYNSKNQILLATVRLIAFDSENKPHTIRAVLDCGSQSNIITNSCMQNLKLNSQKTDLSIIGINGSCSSVTNSCKVKVQSIHNNFSVTLSCIMLQQIPGLFPNVKVNVPNLKIPCNVKLADPSFDTPDDIDLLIGNALFWSLICSGQKSLGPHKPILRETKFGWVVTGSASEMPNSKVYCNVLKTEWNSEINDIQNNLTRFWEIEEIAKEKVFNKEEVKCELHFVENTVRNKHGRFVVKIPFKDSTETLGKSKESATKRFLSLERKLINNPTLKEQYKDFMLEYERLEHMSLIKDDENSGYYLPHHGVLKQDRETTKLRVVFDGSAATSTGISLNDLQMVGPVIQDDLFSVILRFRKHTYVMTADVQKMYRQVLISHEQRIFQKILWRADPSLPINVYQLNTVTYGTASASFLAIRALQQLANECKYELPSISYAIAKDFYVDDLITGTESIDEALYLCQNLSEVLKRGCFELRKWVTNEPQILANIPQSYWSNAAVQFGTGSNSKTLGLVWSCDSDSLTYKISPPPIKKPGTKRQLLSDTSQIFDPLGLVSPCIIIAKGILQTLWLAKIGWDEPLPSHISDVWAQFREEIVALNELNVDRHVILQDYKIIEVHGFSDASERAYGGCIYLKSTDRKNGVSVRLLCAKTKVAPLKPLTTPRLELCGALTLARLFEKVQGALNVEINSCTFWCDSTIVLGWLKIAPNLLQSFISNRVSEISELTKSGKWRHVPSKQNPADILSRGLKASELIKNNLWWYGPEWLTLPESNWPCSRLETVKLPELRKSLQVFTTTVIKEDPFTIKNHSDLNKLERIVAYCLRFINNIKGKNPSKDTLNLSEISRASEVLSSIAQREFTTNFEGSKNPFPNLSLFKDEKGLIRVGGRLQNTNLARDQIHPILLPAKHHLTNLIFQREHSRLLHVGPQTLLYSIRTKFWPIGGRNIARKVVRNCVKCFKANPRFTNPIMGNLPEHRVKQTVPFGVTGVDYAGPFLIKNKRGRGAKISKCYVSLFVCFTTKAVHLELVTDLTTEAFIMAFRRFVSRRGLPSHMYSDNATNFIGTNSELKELNKFLKQNAKKLTESLMLININWHFIPPRSPHFGGLWEAGVRSMKHHLKRVCNSSLTFEEMYTLIVQIEAILNSRPLSPLPTDTEDPLPLTPSHFLLGHPTTGLPDPSLMHLPEGRLSHYQRVQQIRQHFWARWHKEYLNELQQRHKWQKESIPIKENDVVLISEDNIPPMQWRMGKVVQLHPGKDGTVRAVTLKTKTGTFKRATNKVCVLPTNPQ